MVKKILSTIMVIAIILGVLSLASCGSKEEEKEHVHDYGVYGKCIDCGDISQETMENLESVAKTIIWTMWYINYDKVIDNNKIEVEFKKVENDGNKYYTKGYVVAVLDDGTRYRTDIEITNIWSDESNQFVRDSSSIGDTFDVYDNNYERTYTFKSTNTFVNYNTSTGKKNSELYFYSDGSVTQYTYSIYGYIASTTNAKYEMKKTPDYYIITVTANNGVEQTMTYYENLGIYWNGNTYIKPIY